MVRIVGVFAALSLALVGCSSCSKESSETKPAASPSAAKSAEPAKVTGSIKIDNPQVDMPTGATRHLGGDHFTLDLASQNCKAGATCVLMIRLQIADGYHVNKEYPYKFTAKETENVEFLGKSDKLKFTKEDGDFGEIQDGAAAVMNVRFKPAAAGKHKIAGVYKMSLCSADQCQIEEPALELVVPAS